MYVLFVAWDCYAEGLHAECGCWTSLSGIGALQLDSKWTGVGLQGRDFTIVFRSFGADVADVVEEMDAFATGQHPSYPEVTL